MPPIALSSASLDSLIPRFSIPSSFSSLTQHLRRSRDVSIQSLTRRQDSTTAIIPTAYRVDGPGTGAVVGITLGSVAGFLLLLLLFYYLSNPTAFVVGGREEVVVTARPRSRSPGRRRSHRSTRSEIREVRRESRSPRPQRIIVEERRETVRPPRPPSVVIDIDERIVEERRGSRGPPPIRRVDGDDIVEVIEEGSSINSPPRRDRRRRRSSGYRQVDPELYAGGDYPQRPVGGSRGGSRRYS